VYSLTRPAAPGVVSIDLESATFGALEGRSMTADPADPDADLVPEGYVANLFNVAGRVAVITGGASGLGRALSMGFAQAGAAVVVIDINDDGGRTTARLITEQGGASSYRHVDVTNSGELAAAADWVVTTHGRVDILVNSAGAAFRAPAEEFPEDKFDFVVDLNLKGTYLCCQAFGRKMLGQLHGSIINVASIGSFVAYPLASAYLASKGGVLQLTRALALEWRDRGVRVNAIAPGLIETALTRMAAQQSSRTADFIKARMLRPPVARPRDVIGAAIFLASDGAELVTGHVVACDDGYLTA
jgi:NAD(P)-dependent dehydrogenase (short-subunit alcohol dehydrogenase family)